MPIPMRGRSDSLPCLNRMEQGDCMSGHTFGYKPGTAVAITRTACRWMSRLLKLDGATPFSNEFIQQLDPQYRFVWRTGNREIPLCFRTGHGRLLWRAKTFLTEEPLMLEWIGGFTRSDIFLDIGANVGTYTVPAAFLAGTVYACELDPMNVSILQENLFLNGVLDTVIIFPFPCGAEKSVERIYYRDFSKGDALQSVGRESPFDTRKGKSYTARQLVLPIDAVIGEFGLQQPNKIKIDVDGNERIVLGGARDTLMKAEEVYMECSDDEDSRWAVDCLRELGFAEGLRQDVANVPGAYNAVFRRTQQPSG
ncbi:FkbM family methyltransferase [Azospirillum sp. Sh1]|uniref:FkbM family methyltransferase n=1 Tax=Azospirillum sp. Sh1 TaxID=2607285 RepID=UPI00165D82F1|nr:FkbM family methyltransferase [Azospirillum sp. Sh1]